MEIIKINNIDQIYLAKIELNSVFYYITADDKIFTGDIDNYLQVTDNLILNKLNKIFNCKSDDYDGREIYDRHSKKIK